MSDGEPLAEQQPDTGAQSPGRPPVRWSAYILECADGSLYSGVAIDVARRMRDHATPKGSRYVRGHGGVKALLWSCELPSRAVAQRVEYHLKRATRQRKLAIIETAKLPVAWLAVAAPRKRGDV